MNQKSKHPADPFGWLRAVGSERDGALKAAANVLLEEYRAQKSSAIQPINVYRLAAVRHSKILIVKNLPGGGRLLPVTGGFQILIGDNLPEARFRATVAHELVHSLFYHRTDSDVPTRLFPPSRAEHLFCLDAIRHVLAPEWLLERAGLFTAANSDIMFDLLNRGLRISRPLAARLMLFDYELRTGVADRWVFEKNEWTIENGNSCVSPSISGPRKRETEIRRWLRSIALRMLTGELKAPAVETVCLWETEKNAAFILVTNQRRTDAALKGESV